jgi:farnesol dehydrogenase
MTNILITGGTGFIGVPLVKQLHDLGHNLKLTIRENSNIEPFQDLKNIEFIKADVSDIDSLYKSAEGINLIYHLAAYTRLWARDKSTWENVNINGTENVAKVAMDKKIRLIYVSSFIALGATSAEPVDETYESEEGLLLKYAKTKFQAKKLIKNYIKEGLNVTIFYPGITYGPGDFNIFGQTILEIATNCFMGCPGKGDSVGSFVYVDDIVSGLVSVIDNNDLKGEEFILGGINIKFADWLDLISEISGNKKKPRHFPMSAALFYALLCEFRSKLTKKSPYINRPTVKMMNHNWSYNSDKAIKAIGYTITPLEEGLKKTISWYKDYNERTKKKKDKKKK